MNRRKNLIWGLPIAVCCVIFYLTLQNNEDTMIVARTAQKIITDSVNIPTKNPDRSWIYNIAKMRKLAHIPEYALLGATVAISWRMYTLSRKKVFCRSICMCLAISLLDQTMKQFLAGREFDVTDIPFDIIGSVLGILVSFFIMRCFKNKIDK